MTQPFSVLVTGCNGGIGVKIAETFANAGWRVVGVGRKQADNPHVHHFVRADLAEIAGDETALQSFAEQIMPVIQSFPLRALINNAADQILAPVETLSVDQFNQSMLTNTTAPFALSKQFLSELEKTKGAILNIGSVHAQATKPGFVAYATSKAALHGLTRAMAVELGPRVRVNTLAPAATATPMLVAGFEGDEEALKKLEDVHPIGRIAKADEIARLALFLVSDDAAFVTGATLYADGGVLSRLHDPA